MTKTDYFYIFLKHKINSGTKQIDMIRSGHLEISKQYLSKIIREQPKRISAEIQATIAKCFHLTYDEMIADGKRLYVQFERDIRETEELKYTPKLDSNTKERSEDIFKSSRNLIDLTTSIHSGIREYRDYMLKIEREKDALIDLVNNLKSYICVVDSDLNITYQNPYHRQVFGNITGEKYTFFWDNSLSGKAILETLTTETQASLDKEYKDKRYNVQFSLIYHGNVIEKIIEQVTPKIEDNAASEETLKQLEIYLKVLKHLDCGFGFFNNKRELEIASDKFGVLDQYNFPNIRPSIDQLLLDLNEKIESSSLHQIPKMKKAYENRQEINLEVKIDGINYNFQTKNISMNDEHIGILLIVRKTL